MAIKAQISPTSFTPEQSKAALAHWCVAADSVVKIPDEKVMMGLPDNSRDGVTMGQLRVLAGLPLRGKG
jgi:hypothetical protein